MINLLPADCEYQFIDDDLSIHGKYYPPFQSVVNGIDALDAESATTLIIGSRTFFQTIVKQLPTNKWNVVGITELLNKEI